ncbi:hypothetical protein AKJ09_09534 [Labilithrix luteola]|uniref:DUF790 family protein n=1 Tax=Labilithrix luteola TaxID=1391654 RepID=A0A0K1QAQ5_9BACT|nr:DUF790 family protein [Labilithrix luteola]AKV02871.1 hypothetical protein AKJ09_09534 [Labilithrix luteola]
MLTADLAEARRSGDELVIKPLDTRGRVEARELAAAYLDAATNHLGSRREDLEAAWDAISQEASKPKRAAAVRKLVEDACVFEAEPTVSPQDVRRAVFSHASLRRRNRGASEPFDRDAVIAEVATSLGLTPERTEQALFADLRGEQRLVTAPQSGAESFAAAYELARPQAVLLRAARVVCEIDAPSPGPLRAFFGRLKFHKLLFGAERVGERSIRVTVDGPFSMFESVTRYGVRFALLLPALRELERWTLRADVRWGPSREQLGFTLSSGDVTFGDDAEPHVADDVRDLAEALRALRSPYRVELASTLLDVPGVGICVPDLVLRHEDGGPPVYVEVLGFWSRDAVFRRIDLAERGLGERVVFAVSARLRVSAELLEESDSAALYVYKGKMSARAVLEHVARLGSAGPSTHAR